MLVPKAKYFNLHLLKGTKCANCIETYFSPKSVTIMKLYNIISTIYIL